MAEILEPERVQALGQSEPFLGVQERISRAARTDRPVILIGERGTGKELAAARLHLLSSRWGQPYIELNCASLSPTLIESELFGHEAGAFTGATRLRRGRFELADGGSLFLDEVADIPLTAQEKILRAVEYGRFERVGGSATIQTDVRLIAATNADLRRLAREGKFREDLLDRLSFEVLTLPSLRERRDDIPLLAQHFARRMAAELGRQEPPVFSSAAMSALIHHDWPGNVRELKNVVERMVYRADGAELSRIVFDPFDSPFRPRNHDGGTTTADSGPGADSPSVRALADGLRTGPPEPSVPDDMGLEVLPLEQAVEALRVRRMRAALERTGFNQRRAAESLGLTYHQFRGYYRKLRSQLDPAG
jgi:psp operon transcriptional activator